MVHDLVFDIGMNRGEDTAYYLSRGLRVVAVEANPKLVGAATYKFAEAIKANRLFIESVAIAEQSGTCSFFVSDVNDDWSSIEKVTAGREGTQFHEEIVPAVTMRELFSKYGVPYYLKIDIERADRHCLECLNSEDLPTYVSIEAHEFEYLLILWKLGYRQFKIIDQMRHNSRWPDFSNENTASRLAKQTMWHVDRIKNRFGKVRYVPGSSGPFGEETHGPWLSLEDVAYNWLHFHRGYFLRGNLQKHSWFDFHAKV